MSEPSLPVPNKKPGKKRLDWMPALLTAGLVSGFLAVIFALFRYTVPDGNKDTLYFMAGQLSVFTGMGVGYWLQSTFSSSSKTDIIAKSGPVDPHT